MGASTRTGEQEGIATATLAAAELEATFATGAPMTATVSGLTHPGDCPRAEAYDATFAVEVASTMSA